MPDNRVGWLATSLLFLLGCAHTCYRPATPVGPGPGTPGGIAPPVFPGPPAGATAAPGVGLPVPPAPVGSPGPVTSQLAPPYPQTSVLPPTVGEAAPHWQAAPGLAPAGGSISNGQSEGARLLPPQETQPFHPPISPPAPPSTREPSRTAAPSLPAGIPQFAFVQEKIATGRRPLLDDGLDWLQANGYRTVLHLHLPSDDIATDQRQAEKRGLTYEHLEVAPNSLSEGMVERFSQIVQDKKRLPLFVYDREGDLAGTLWYLYFRLIEHMPDDAARIRAGALGLRPEQDEAHRAMWLDAQRLLNARAR